MEFESDLFVSYAHIDDQALVEGQKGWISNLHRALEIRLAQLRGKQPKIWRDPKLTGNDVFSDKLVDRVRQVALLVSVLSPRYVNSDWCTRELRLFMDASEQAGGLRCRRQDPGFQGGQDPDPARAAPAGAAAGAGLRFLRRRPGDRPGA